MANGKPDLVALFCQRCGNKISEDEAKNVKMTQGQQRGLVLQLCFNCARIHDRPAFLNRAIYK
jgi:RNase P subunit RPR2